MKKILITILLFACIGSVMSQVKISAMPTATNNGSGAYIPIVQSGINKKILADSLAKLSVKTTLLGYLLTKDSLGGYDRINVDSLKLDSLLNARAGGPIDSTIWKTVYDAYLDSLVQRAAIALKLNISDTAAMVAGYVRIQRFLDSLAAHNLRLGTNTVAITTKANQTALQDTAAAIRADFPSPGSSVTKVYQELFAPVLWQTVFNFTTIPTTAAGYTICINGGAIQKRYFTILGNTLTFLSGIDLNDSVTIQGIQ